MPLPKLKSKSACEKRSFSQAERLLRMKDIRSSLFFRAPAMWARAGPAGTDLDTIFVKGSRHSQFEGRSYRRHCHPRLEGSSRSNAVYSSALQIAAATLLPPLLPIAAIAGTPKASHTSIR